MSEHPGRLALLTRAAYTPGVSEVERENLIRLGAPGWPKAEVLDRLREAYRLHQQRQGMQAAAVLHSLLEPPGSEVSHATDSPSER